MAGNGDDVVHAVESAESLLYDSRDLVTHAVVVGMTGSGKTGLGSRRDSLSGFPETGYG
jgi:hypothetical protein